MSYPSQMQVEGVAAMPLAPKHLQTALIPNFVVLPRGEVCFYQTVPALLVFDLEDVVRPYLGQPDTFETRERLTWEVRTFLFKAVYEGVLCKDLRGRWIYRPGDLL